MGSNLERMTAALQALLERDNDDAFVIFTDVQGGKFVQFSGGSNEDLVLDMPEQEMGEDEMARAKRFFASRGRKDAWQGDTFNVNLAREVEAAAQMAMGVFAEVFRLPAEFQIEIEEN